MYKNRKNSIVKPHVPTKLQKLFSFCHSFFYQSSSKINFILEILFYFSNFYIYIYYFILEYLKTNPRNHISLPINTSVYFSSLWELKKKKVTFTPEMNNFLLCLIFYLSSTFLDFLKNIFLLLFKYKLTHSEHIMCQIFSRVF